MSDDPLLKPEAECPDCQRPLGVPATQMCRFPGAHRGYTPWRSEPDPPMTKNDTIVAVTIAVCLTLLVGWIFWLWLGG